MPYHNWEILPILNHILHPPPPPPPPPRLFHTDRGNSIIPHSHTHNSTETHYSTHTLFHTDRYYPHRHTIPHRQTYYITQTGRPFHKDGYTILHSHIIPQVVIVLVGQIHTIPHRQTYFMCCTQTNTLFHTNIIAFCVRVLGFSMHAHPR